MEFVRYIFIDNSDFFSLKGYCDASSVTRRRSVLHSDHSATKTDHQIYSHCVLQMMLNTTNQSINLPDALIEKCFGQNFVHVQLSQIIFMKNSQPRHFISKNKSP